MALLQVSWGLIQESDLFDVLKGSFDTFELVEKRQHHALFRVQNDEIPVEDIVICPDFISFEGIKPFAVDWGTDYL